MNVKRSITPSITIGDQPTEADLDQLKQEGYTGVVNLRNDGEPEQPMSTDDEGNKVRALGMDYLHSGVGAMPLTMHQVLTVCNFIAQPAREQTRCSSIAAGARARPRWYYYSRLMNSTGPARTCSPRARKWAWRLTAV